MDRAGIEGLIKESYAARARGDLDATRRTFAENPRFELAGSPGASPVPCCVEGCTAFEATLRGMIEVWEWKSYTLVSTLIDGNQAAVRWRATLRHTGTDQTVETEAVDLLTIENGKIAFFLEFCDTALARQIAG